MTELKDQISGFELSKLAKDKGFDVPTQRCYLKDGRLTQSFMDTLDFSDTSRPGLDMYECETTIDNGLILLPEMYIGDWNNKTNDISAPTQSLLQRWLRDEHSIHVNPIHSPHSQCYSFKITGCYHEGNEGILVNSRFTKHDSYEIVMEIALQEALKLIVINNKDVQETI